LILSLYSLWNNLAELSGRIHIFFNFQLAVVNQEVTGEKADSVLGRNSAVAENISPAFESALKNTGAAVQKDQPEPSSSQATGPAAVHKKTAAEKAVSALSHNAAGAEKSSQAGTSTVSTRAVEVPTLYSTPKTATDRPRVPQKAHMVC
jgi:hypothetical protein